MRVPRVHLLFAPLLADEVSLLAVMAAYAGLGGIVALLSRGLDGSRLDRSGQHEAAAVVDSQTVGQDG